MRNPFGGEVSGYQFYDRAEMVETLRMRLTAGSCNIVMFAPRRYGKTSLVAKVLRLMREKDGIPSLMFDLSMVPTLSRFCEEYVDAVYAMAGGRQELAHWVVNFLATYSTLLRGLSDSQKTLVLALVQEPTREFDEEYRNRHDLPASSTVHSALKELIKDAIVEDGGGTYSIGDPILSRYVLASPGKVNP